MPQLQREKLFSVTKKDFRVEFFRASGKGGQNRNKRDTACRITHLESGAVSVAKEERSQGQNKRTAFRRLVESKPFQSWVKLRASEVVNSKQKVEESVDRLMKEKNLRVDVKDEVGKWVQWTEMSTWKPMENGK
jgi:protein subunit release factor A